jgi:AcrR family transcriptional regulator
VNATGVRSRRRQEMTARIIDAARQLLQQTGSASLRAVANEVGVTTPALYRYVSGPEGLMAMVTERADQALSHEIRTRLERVDSTDRVEALVVTATEVWQWARRHPDEFRLVADAASRSRPIPSPAPISATAAIFDEIVCSSHPRHPLADQPSVAAQMSAQLWSSLLMAASPRSYGDDIESAAARFVALLAIQVHHLDGPEALGHLARNIPELLDALRPSQRDRPESGGRRIECSRGRRTAQHTGTRRPSNLGARGVIGARIRPLHEPRTRDGGAPGLIRFRSSISERRAGMIWSSSDRLGMRRP